MEVALDKLDASVLALITGYFMENFLLQAASPLYARLGKSVEYVKQSGEEVKAQLSSWGLSKNVQQELMDLFFLLWVIRMDPMPHLALYRQLQLQLSSSF
jgi:hypothetical protein